MKKNFDRRDILKTLVTGIVLTYFNKTFAATSELSKFVLANNQDNPGNFQAIYGSPELKEQFFSFLSNVYNIYPEKEFHSLIGKLVDKNTSDEKIYSAILANIKSIKPFFADLTYALPALAKQKGEIANQTMELLKDKKSVHGYLEIGSPGRYISELEHRLKIKGDIALVNITKPKYSPADIVERGQLKRIGRYIPLNDYAPIKVESKSFEVVTNYIGFHHSNLVKLNDFVVSIHSALKPGGSLILRDHDVIDEKMNHMVSLAHDVFNAGLKVDWKTNHEELRNFRSLEQWIAYLKDRGFEYKNQQIYQKGDPTKNALMRFIKT